MRPVKRVHTRTSQSIVPRHGMCVTALRNESDCAWLQDYGHKEVKYILKYLADAFQAFFAGGGYLRFKSKYHTQVGFTSPSEVKVSDTHLYVPKTGCCGSKATIPMPTAYPDRLAFDRKGRNPSSSGMRILPIPCPRTCCAKTNRIIRPTLWTTCWPFPRHPTTMPLSCHPEPETTVPGKSISDVLVGHRRRLSFAAARAECGCVGVVAQSDVQLSAHQCHHSGRNPAWYRPATQIPTRVRSTVGALVGVGNDIVRASCTRVR